MFLAPATELQAKKHFCPTPLLRNCAGRMFLLPAEELQAGKHSGMIGFDRHGLEPVCMPSMDVLSQNVVHRSPGNRTASVKSPFANAFGFAPALA